MAAADKVPKLVQLEDLPFTILAISRRELALI
jgi:hypothetical protein